MAVKAFILLITLLEFVRATNSLSRFDYSLGVNSVNSTTPPMLIREIEPTTLNISFTNLYSFSLVNGADRLARGEIGGLWSFGVNRLAFNIEYLEAFSTFHDTRPQLSYGVILGRFLSLQATLSGRFISVDFDHDEEFSFGFGGAINIEKIVLGLIFEVEGIANDIDRSIPLGRFDIVVRASDNILGSQGARFRWNYTDNIGEIMVAFNYPITEWVGVGVNFKSEPFLIGLSLNISSTHTATTLLFDRHPYLGWSQSVGVDYKNRR